MTGNDSISFLPLGALLQTLPVPPSNVNVVLSLPTQAAYAAYAAEPYLGETIGRVANRIAGARIDSLNGGRSYDLASANDRGATLHGGLTGWGKRVWDGPRAVGLGSVPGLDQVEIGGGSGLSSGDHGSHGDDPGPGPGPGLGPALEGGETVEFTLKSDDGDEGFPGELLVRVLYTTGSQRTADGKEVRVLAMEYEAEITDDTEETVINMTNHSYFNLNPSSPTVAGTSLTLCSTVCLPVSPDGIPTGAPPTAFLASASASAPAMQPDCAITLGPTAPDIDACFVADPTADPAECPIDTRSRPLRRVVAAAHPDSRIRLEVLTTEPAFQLYTGRDIDLAAAEDHVPGLGRVSTPARGPRSGFSIEPGRLVNAVNQPAWRNQVLLKRGQKYGSRIVYRTWTD